MFLAPTPDQNEQRREVLAGAHAVLRRRRSGHGLGGWMRDQLSRRSRPGSARASAIHLRQGVEIGRPSDIFLSARRENRASPMSGWRAALFLWQEGSFSCHDAHAFNRNSL